MSQVVSQEGLGMSSEEHSTPAGTAIQWTPHLGNVYGRDGTVTLADGRQLTVVAWHMDGAIKMLNELRGRCQFYRDLAAVGYYPDETPPITGSVTVQVPEDGSLVGELDLNAEIVLSLHKTIPSGEILEIAGPAFAATHGLDWGKGRYHTFSWRTLSRRELMWRCEYKP